MLPSSELPAGPRRSATPFRVLFWRALRLRCPNCGGRPIFLTWARLVPSCPVCGLGLERGEEGYWLGAYFFNLMAVETIFSIWFGGFLLLTWPSPPWVWFQVGTIVVMLLVPVVCFPYSKTLFLAFDLLVRPPTSDDFAAPHEQARNIRQG